METQNQTQNKQQVTVEKVSVPKKTERFNRITTIILWILVVSFIVRLIVCIREMYVLYEYDYLFDDVFQMVHQTRGYDLMNVFSTEYIIDICYYTLMVIILLVLVIKQRTNIYGLLLLFYAYAIPIFKFVLLSSFKIGNTNVSIAYILGQELVNISVVLLILTIAMLCKHNGKTGFEILVDLDDITMYM